ncbi:xanthine dehydrogenase family protein subunit M [Mumia sp. ZJ430]|uniref:FAD binding domain-containing protein n=1 Tax=Mumia sp. ZJ430 TaxID=2708083 RepID=UPI00142050E0|nr:xanthine dehydrogenase family protein subunit M [Mumia sp. ZJ430]
MIPSPFSYRRASSVDHALDLLVEHGDEAKLLCGGHSLLPLMKLRLANPTTLVDIRTLSELRGIRADGDRLLIGAATRHRELENDPDVARMAPLLAKAAATIGDPQVRARGTIGGSVVHADPAADLAAALLALDATVTLRGPRGTREVAISDFFVDFWQTAIEPDEVLTMITVPSSVDLPVSFVKFHQRAQDWAIVGVAAVGGTSPRVALVNMAATPVRARAVEEALTNGAGIADAAALADVGTAPSKDLRADATYRRHLARVMTARALAEVV